MFGLLTKVTRVFSPSHIARSLPALSVNGAHQPTAASFSILSTPAVPNPMLRTISPLLNFTCGMKVKGHLKRRCKDCYFVWRQERLYVMCKTHGRHKQMQMKKREYNTWILTHAFQGKNRGY